MAPRRSGTYGPSMRATPLPEGALLPRSRWREMGVSTTRLASSQFLRPLPGLLTPRDHPAWFDDVASALQTTLIPGLRDPRSGRRRLSLFASRNSPEAPPVTDLDSLTPGHPALELTLPHMHCRIPPDRRRRAGRNVTVHQMAPGATLSWHGLLLSSPAELLLELATTLEHDEVVIAIDHVLGPNSAFGPTTRETVRRALEPYRRRPGYRRVLRAFADARGGVESPGETRTRLLVTRAGFPEPIPNLRVPDPHSGITRRIDNAYASLLIGLEYDGDIHRSRGAWREEHARRDSLESAGWTLRRLTAADVRVPGRFLSALRRTFLARGHEAPPESAWQGSAGKALRRPIPHATSPRPTSPHPSSSHPTSPRPTSPRPTSPRPTSPFSR